MVDENKDVWSSLTKTEILSAIVLGGMQSNPTLTLEAAADPSKLIKTAALYAVRLQKIAKEVEEKLSGDDAVN